MATSLFFVTYHLLGTIATASSWRLWQTGQVRVAVMDRDTEAALFAPSLLSFFPLSTLTTESHLY